MVEVILELFLHVRMLSVHCAWPVCFVACLIGENLSQKVWKMVHIALGKTRD